MTPLSINIIGSGSMGHLWTAYLLACRANTKLYGKNSIPNQAYHLHSPKKSFHYTTNIETLNSWRAADFIIICVKSTALETLCRQLKKITTTHPPILLMMNGMGILEIVNEILPNTPVYQASTTHGVKLDNRNLYHTGSGETLIGEINTVEERHQGQIFRLISTLNNALPITKWSEQHLQTLWAKLIINAIINPLTAIHNITNGIIVDDPKINLQAKRLTQQLSPLIQKYLPFETWQSLFEKVGTIANQTYTNISSMRQDILTGRKTEIDYITGYILNKAITLNIVLPDHEIIFHQIKELEVE